jgi:hypothetical protein
VIKNQESYPQKKIEGGEKSVIFLRVPVLFGGKKAGEAKKKPPEKTQTAVDFAITAYSSSGKILD